MFLFLDELILSDAIEQHLLLPDSEWIAFLSCTEEDFRQRYPQAANMDFEKAKDKNRVMFRDEGETRPDTYEFESFLFRHGFDISWAEWAEMNQYHRAEAAAVVEFAKECYSEQLEKLILVDELIALNS